MSVATTTTPSKLDTTASKTPEQFLSKTVISKSSAKPDRKVNPIDNKLENRLTIKDLNKLQRAFMTEGDGYDNKLALYKDQFCEALSILLDKGSREEYGELFDKIDVAREGTVDWDKFASHMLLEFYERDDRVKSTQVPQWRDLKTLPSPHKDIIQRIAHLKNTNRYIAISKEGSISLWGQDLRLQRAFRTGTDSCKARDLWVTHFVPLQQINKLALAFTSKEIAIYDMSTKLDFNCQYKVQGLPHTPLCLDYWSNPNNSNEALLVWGDVGGYVNALFFSSANIALFERPPAPAGEKQVRLNKVEEEGVHISVPICNRIIKTCVEIHLETCLNVLLPHIQEGRYKNVQYTQHESNKGEWIRQVKYSQYLECFISCASTSHNSMVIGWMEKHSAVAQPKNTQVSKEILRTSVFHIQQGIHVFDYNQHLNLIATAGVNHHVCLWNPYVVSKPNGVLRGHMASVIQVQFIKSRGQLISFSKDKVLRIWDVQLQVCIQRVAGMFPKGPEVISTLYFDETKDRNGLERNRLLITFNYQLSFMEMKLEIRDRVLSHDKPVLAAIYNHSFNQVISVCQSGTIIVWMIDTGQKVKQFNHTHGSSEVTCLAQDAQETKFFTGSTDGTVKIWDYNGHCYHTLDCAGGQPADVGQILNLKRSVVVVGLAKDITVFRDASFKEHTVEPDLWKGQSEHVEDILCAAHTTPHQLATGSYDGEIVLWNSNSEQTSKRLCQRAKKRETEKTFITVTRETTVLPDSAKSRPKSRPISRKSMAVESDQEGTSYMVSTLLYLEARKTNSAGNGANLLSCGGNGWVRFWNTNNGTLLAEFVAHQHAGIIIMATDKKNQYLVTADVDGAIKVWEILEYCLNSTDEVITQPPPLKTTFQPHSDMINALIITERNDRLLVVSASSDCSVVLSDIYGNMIGIFGQEEHWKIEPFDPEEDFPIEKEEEEEDLPVEQEEEKPESDEESNFEPDEEAINDPEGYRINTWEQTVLGKNYQEARVRKRERRQPGTIPDLPYLHWERTGQAPAGPYSALDIQTLGEYEPTSKPDVMAYTERGTSPTQIPKLPALVETLRQPVPEKEIFPKYILDFEAKMKSYHQMQLSQSQTGKGKGMMARTSLQNIGIQLGQQSLKSPPKNLKQSLKKGKPVGGSRRPSMVSTDNS